jgi:hypothetical protein
MHTRGFVYSLLLASAAAVGFASSAYSFTLTDDPSVSGSLSNTIYYGAANSYNGADVIGTSTFNIIDAVVSRSGTNNNTLNIIINTNYAGAPGTGAADGTTYGSLFLNPFIWSVTGSSSNNYSTDNFVGGNQNWAYAVTTPSTGSGASDLYATGLNAGGLSGAGAPHNSNGVPQYYTTADGTIYMSNVNSNPLSAPTSGNPGYYFRQGQAVVFNPIGSDPSLGAVTVSKVNGSYIEYSIVDGGLLGNTFALSWAMTCANDVIQGLVQLGNNDLTGSTPIPATLPLFASGIGGIVLLARRRSKKTAAPAVAA